MTILEQLPTSQCPLPLNLLHQQRQLLLGLITLLICRVGDLNDPCHVLPLLLQLLFQALVDVVEDHFFAAETVDLLAQLLV